MHESALANTIIEVIPERYAELTAGFLQAGEGIATASTEVAAGAAADFAFFHVVAHIPFAAIGVQRDVRPFQRQQQLCFVLTQAPEQLVQALIAGFLAEERVKALLKGFFDFLRGFCL